MNNGIDLRKEMDEMLKEFGFFVLLQRTNRKIRCRCWNEGAGEALSKCPLCLGTGWVSRIERHRIRNDSAVQIVTRPNLNVLAPVGNTYIDARNFYMRYDSNPQVGDYIFEVGWSPMNPQKPTHMMRAFEINDVFAARGDGGRIEYYLVSAKSDIVQVDIRNVAIRSLGPLKNYEFVKGARKQ